MEIWKRPEPQTSLGEFFPRHVWGQHVFHLSDAEHLLLEDERARAEGLLLTEWFNMLMLTCGPGPTGQPSVGQAQTGWPTDKSPHRL